MVKLEVPRSCYNAESAKLVNDNLPDFFTPVRLRLFYHL